jgi:hypothetical protein
MGKLIAKKIAAVLLLILLVFCLLYSSNRLGLPASWIEQRARSSQKIAEDWLVSDDASDSMAALIFYPEDGDDHVFSIYVNRSGVSFGYFFCGGGSLGDALMEYTVEGISDRAFLSQNKQHVARLEIDDGSTVEVREIDPEKPFALVLPADAGSVTFYDVDGNPVTPQAASL